MAVSPILQGICSESTEHGGIIYIVIILLCLFIGWALGHDWKVSKKFERKIKKIQRDWKE